MSDRRILVPTDFSKCAHSALGAAMEVASQFNADVHLIHFMPPEPGEVASGLVNEILPDIEHKFAEIKSKYSVSNIEIHTKIYLDYVYDGISKYVDEHDVKLIVMGSKGVGGLKSLLWGSNAQKVVNQSSIPVLVIKKELENIDFKRILFASDFRKEAMKPFHKLIDFGIPFSSHIYLTHIDTPQSGPVDALLAKQKMGKFDEACWRLACTQHVITDKKVKTGILNFAAENDIDLIGLVSHGENFFQKLAKGGSVAEQLVKDENMSILALPV